MPITRHEGCWSLREREGSAGRAQVKRIIPRPQIFPIGEGKAHAEDADFHLRAHIPEPLLRAQAARGIGNFPRVQKGREPEGNQTVAIKILVDFEIRQEVTASEGRTPLSPVAGSDVRT